jgi:V8-like Glu-specific endopeptidase
MDQGDDQELVPLTHIDAEWRTDVPSIEATVVDHAVVFGNGEVGLAADLPLDLSAHIPMPLPQRDQSRASALADGSMSRGQIVSYDLRTGEERYSAAAARVEDEMAISGETTAGPGGGIPRVAVEDKGEIVHKNFNGLSWVSDTTTSDYPRSVKLFFQQDGSYWVCSGSLIDPMHVITAGHCVHSGNGGNWSTNMVVVPAYDDGVEPYGRANGIQLHSWTGWTLNGNFDYDIGVIDLDRPVGALTGWHGYGYHNDCA